MTDQEIQGYYKTDSGKAVKEFVESLEQKAVVLNVSKRADMLHILCCTPAWGYIIIETDDTLLNIIQRGDIVMLRKQGSKYSIVSNETPTKIIAKVRDEGIDLILKQFTNDQRRHLPWVRRQHSKTK